MGSALDAPRELPATDRRCRLLRDAEYFKERVDQIERAAHLGDDLCQIVRDKNVPAASTSESSSSQANPIPSPTSAPEPADGATP